MNMDMIMCRICCYVFFSAHNEKYEIFKCYAEPNLLVHCSLDVQNL